MTLTKDQIAGSLQSRLGVSKAESVSLVESMIETIKATLARGEDVLISGFGKFCVNQKAPRRGRNPATGKELTLQPRRVVTFRSSHLLKRRVNRKGV